MKKGFKRQASMDMFIVRSPKKSPAPSPTKDRAGMRQATLESLRGVVVVEDMERAVVVLERLDVSPDLKVDTLQHLLRKNPAKEVLIRTGLGKTVHKLCHDKNAEVAAAAQKVYRAWKKHILSKVNRPCIEVKTDLRTQRLRNSARQMLSDALQREDGGGGEGGGDDKRRRDSSDALKRDNELDNNNRGRKSSDASQRQDKKEENNNKGRRGSSEEEDRIRDRIVYEVFKRDRNRDRQKEEDKEGRSEGIKARKRTEEEVVSKKRKEKRIEREEEEEERIGTTQKRKRQEEEKEEEEEEEKSKEKHRHRKYEKEKESKEGRERPQKSKNPEKEEKMRDTEKHKEKNPVRTSNKEEEKGAERVGEGGRTKKYQTSSEKKGSERGEERKTKASEKLKEENPVTKDPEEDTSARHDPVEVIAEHIEREVYHASQRLLDNAYRRTVRALVFTLRHQAEVRRTVSSATLSVPEFVKQYRKS